DAGGGEQGDDEGKSHSRGRPLLALHPCPWRGDTPFSLGIGGNRFLSCRCPRCGIVAGPDPYSSRPAPRAPIMEIRIDDYEKLGKFYLGRSYDLEEKSLNDELVLYDSKDLVTHGVVLGMTGSGKTGLCMALLEEAAMDNIPAIVIDPKGDIANLLLTFPDLTPEDFRPWINEDDAAKKGLSP